VSGQTLTTADQLAAVLDRQDPTLASDVEANLAELQALAPRVIEAMRKVRDHSLRYDQALTDLFGVDGSFLLEDAVLQQVPAHQGIAQAWSLGATIADADPDGAHR